MNDSSNREAADQAFSVTKNRRLVFACDQTGGVTPIVMAVLAHGSDLQGAQLRVGRAGEAAARMMIRAQVASVRARVLSVSARNILDQAGIVVDAERTESVGTYTDDPGERAADEFSQSEVDDTEFFESLKTRLFGVLSHHERPSDSGLVSNRPVRLGSGGGGT